MKNLWGELPSGEEIIPPVTILQEQAGVLTTHYKGILQGKVVQDKVSGRELVYTLIIMAPILNNYTYVVVSLHNEATLYPCKLFDQTVTSGMFIHAANADELENALGRILTSDTVKNVIAALVAQSKSINPPSIF